jgi:hypothetical protein
MARRSAQQTACRLGQTFTSKTCTHSPTLTTMEGEAIDLTALTPKQPAKKQRTLFEVMTTPEQRVAALQSRLAPEVVQQQAQRQVDQEARRQQGAAAAGAAAGAARLGLACEDCRYLAAKL